MNNSPNLSRLFQLISPSLPIGSYTYSQGIEWAVEEGWIRNEEELRRWLNGLMENVICHQELPLFTRMYRAWQDQDMDSLDEWNGYCLASRETLELRQEEKNRARAFADVIRAVSDVDEKTFPRLKKSQLACFSFACVNWNIDLYQACEGLVWSWLENQVLAAVKIIPLGQTAGQRLVFELSTSLSDMVAEALLITDDDIGASSFALSIASSQHETQYTRLFRS